MALINRHKPSETGDHAAGVLRVGTVSRQSYIEHSRSIEVQGLLAEARASWAEHHGQDPAAARLTQAD
jgi:hypothetical protein